jgi:hypothetical protein
MGFRILSSDNSIGVDIARRPNKLGLPKIDGFLSSDTIGRLPLMIRVPWSTAARALSGPFSEANRQNAAKRMERSNSIFSR